MPTPLSRRDFLRLSSLSIVGQAFRTRAAPSRRTLFYGRVLFIYATLYSRPSVYAATHTIHPLETVLPVYAEVEGEDDNAFNRRWYETEGGYIHSSNVQPVQIEPNRPETIAAPTLGEVTVPSVEARREPADSATTVYRLYYSSTHWVQRSVLDGGRKTWYELLGDRYKKIYYVPASAIRIVPASELTPITPLVTDKRILIDTTAQTITALAGGRRLFVTQISSGGNFGPDQDFRTPLGEYQIGRKRPSRHMAAGDGVADDSYNLPGVPWVCYFNEGIALHGTYWHNDFGRAWSHGCINLRSQDAKWFYRWTTPSVRFGQELLDSPGTFVTVV